jgi:hypothetical protein
VAVRAVIAFLVLIASAHARAETTELPRSPALVPEDVTTYWESGESSLRAHFDVYLEVAPLGWGVSRDGNGYGAFARLGAGAFILSRPSVYFVHAGFEVSPQSKKTLGLHVTYIYDMIGVGLGLLAEPSGRLGGKLSVNLLVFGIEAQLRDTDEHGPSGAFYLTLQIPLRRVASGLRSM